MTVLLSRIKDGRTRSGAWAAKNGIDAFSFTFRPALPERVYEYLKSDRTTGRAVFNAITAFISEHLVSWTISETIENEDRAAELNHENICRLPQPVLEFLADAISLYTKADQVNELKN